jgi:hypothetical protein
VTSETKKMKSEEERREKRRGEYLEMDEGEVGREVGLKQDIVSAPLPDLNQRGLERSTNVGPTNRY